MPAPTPTVSCSIDLVKTPKKMLAAMQQSKERGHIVGIYSDALGQGMFLTGIDDILAQDNEPIIVLKQYEVTGRLLARTNFSIDEVTAICCFNIPYVNPATGQASTA